MTRWFLRKNKISLVATDKVNVFEVHHDTSVRVAGRLPRHDQRSAWLDFLKQDYPSHLHTITRDLIPRQKVGINRTHIDGSYLLARTRVFIHKKE